MPPLRAFAIAAAVIAPVAVVQWLFSDFLNRANPGLKDPVTLSGSEFVSRFRTMKGLPIVVNDCRVAGTAATFIRCETRNGAVSYTLETDSMNVEDLNMIYERCPTGSGDKKACLFSVSGTVRNSTMPSIKNSKLTPAPQRR